VITGAHTILYSKDADADRAFLRDVLGLTGVDAGGGWLIFGLPPSEVAVHPSPAGASHELYLLCDDVKAFVADMTARNVACTPVADRRWGLVTEVTLPSGAKLGVYEPRHPRP
jgi:catechol 2,3-dioxygenase-like lactoylglutathione lyase family enzyme